MSNYTPQGNFNSQGYNPQGSFDAQGNFINKAHAGTDAAKAFVAQVFSWMFGALILTATVAYLFASSDLIYYLFDSVTGKPTIFFWVAAFSPIAIVLSMSLGLEKMSITVIIGLFALYSILMGISLSAIFLIYDPMMLVKSFAITAGAFGIMAVAGYTTKADLSKMGSILMLALIGAIIASIFNFFIADQFSQFGFILDIVFVIIFTGLVAWKMQMVRQMGEEVGTTQPKLAVYMALTLYITFINLFMTILRLMRR